MDKNLVIGIEGLVGTGKTSICHELLKYIPNAIVLHAGNIYRAITYQIIKEEIPFEKLYSIDLKDLFKEFEISIGIENRESVVYAHGKKIEEKDLQSLENSMADINKRVEWKAKQYGEDVSRKELKDNILKRDELQEKSGYYQIYDNTIVVDVSDSKSIEESTKMVAENIIELNYILQ